jgi:hypothetical protein
MLEFRCFLATRREAPRSTEGERREYVTSRLLHFWLNGWWGTAIEGLVRMGCRGRTSCDKEECRGECRVTS